MAFARKGNKVAITLRDKQGYAIGETDLHANFDYLILPLLARASFGEDIKFFMNAGPYVGFLLKQTNVQKARFGRFGRSSGYAEFGLAGQ